MDLDSLERAAKAMFEYEIGRHAKRINKVAPSWETLSHEDEYLRDHYRTLAKIAIDASGPRWVH